jgi:hypothetical protein
MTLPLSENSSASVSGVLSGFAIDGTPLGSLPTKIYNLRDFGKMP